MPDLPSMGRSALARRAPGGWSPLTLGAVQLCLARGRKLLTTCLQIPYAHPLRDRQRKRDLGAVAPFTRVATPCVLLSIVWGMALMLGVLAGAVLVDRGRRLAIRRGCVWRAHLPVGVRSGFAVGVRGGAMGAVRSFLP